MAASRRNIQPLIKIVHNLSADLSQELLDKFKSIADVNLDNDQPLIETIVAMMAALQQKDRFYLLTLLYNCAISLDISKSQLYNTMIAIAGNKGPQFITFAEAAYNKAINDHSANRYTHMLMIVAYYNGKNKEAAEKILNAEFNDFHTASYNMIMDSLVANHFFAEAKAFHEKNIAILKLSLEPRAATLDLHHLSYGSAFIYLQQYLLNHKDKGDVLTIIHGRGSHSKNSSILSPVKQAFVDVVTSMDLNHLWTIDERNDGVSTLDFTKPVIQATKQPEVVLHSVPLFIWPKETKPPVNTAPPAPTAAPETVEPTAVEPTPKTISNVKDNPLIVPPDVGSGTMFKFLGTPATPKTPLATPKPPAEPKTLAKQTQPPTAAKQPTQESLLFKVDPKTKKIVVPEANPAETTTNPETKPGSHKGS